MTTVNNLAVLSTLIAKYGIPVYDRKYDREIEYALQTECALYVCSSEEEGVGVRKYPRYASWEMFGVVDLSSVTEVYYAEQDDDDDEYGYEECCPSLSNCVEQFREFGNPNYDTFSDRSLRFELQYEARESLANRNQRFIEARELYREQEFLGRISRLGSPLVTLAHFRAITGACARGCEEFLTNRGLKNSIPMKELFYMRSESHLIQRYISAVLA